MTESIDMEDMKKHMDEAETKAWDSLSRYKFQMFGYWAAIWIHLNRISGLKRPNPWKELVESARVHKRLQCVQATAGIWKDPKPGWLDEEDEEDEE